MQSIGHKKIILDEIDSTNVYAWQLIHNNQAEHGLAVFAHHQTNGKGQFGNTWTNEPCKSLLVSYTWDIKSIPYPYCSFLFIAMVTVSLYECIKNILPISLQPKLFIKWPNDLYYENNKLGGILIENRVVACADMPLSSVWLVVGIGVNINQISFPIYLKNPISLQQIIHQVIQPLDILDQLSNILDKNWQLFKHKPTDDTYIHYYNQYLYKRHEWVKFKKSNQLMSLQIDSVDKDGLLYTTKKELRGFMHGEIQWILP